MLRYYPFGVNLDRCTGSCNTLNDLSNRVCVPKKLRRLKLGFFQCGNKNKSIKNINKSFIIQNVNVSLMAKNVTRIKRGIMINVGVRTLI